MANKKISELPSKNTPSTNDIIPIVDTSTASPTTKKTTLGAVLNILDAVTQADVGVSGGVASLDNSGKVAVSQLPAATASTFGAVKIGAGVSIDSNGVISVSSGSSSVAWTSITGKPSTFTPSEHTHNLADVNGLQTALDGKQPVGSYAADTHTHVVADVNGLQTALDGKQAAGTYATLVGGKVPQEQLPSYVDDILEYADLASLPSIGEAGKIYLTLDDNKVYRWSGSTYVEILAGSSDWSSITGKPTFSTVATSGDYADLVNLPDLSVYALNSALSDVATSGSYNDLLDKPTLSITVAPDWTTNHTIAAGTRYLVNDVVYSGGNIYRALYENESEPVTNATYWQNIGAGSRLNIDGRDIPNIPYPVTSVNGHIGAVLITEFSGDTTNDLTFSTPSHGINFGDGSRQTSAPVIGRSDGGGSIVALGSGNSAVYAYSTVSGGFSNAASAEYATISGGANNLNQGMYSFIGGGLANFVDGQKSAIVSGRGNNVSNVAYYSVIGGGFENTINASGGFIGSGWQNTVSGTYGSVVSGWVNTASGDYSMIAAGHHNTAAGLYSCVLGGTYNVVSFNASRSMIASAGDNNVIASGSGNSIISGSDNSIPNNPDGGVYSNAHIIGSDITADASNTTFVNALKIVDVGAGVTFPDGTTQTTAYTGGSGGNPFNQNLNTTDSPVFAGLSVETPTGASLRVWHGENNAGTTITNSGAFVDNVYVNNLHGRNGISIQLNNDLILSPNSEIGVTFSDGTRQTTAYTGGGIPEWDAATFPYGTVGALCTYGGQVWRSTAQSSSIPSLGSGWDLLTPFAHPAYGLPGDGDVVTYQASTGTWIYAPPSGGGGGGGATTLDGLTDVVVTSPTTGQVLKFDGTNWVNDTDATGGGGSSPYEYLPDVTNAIKPIVGVFNVGGSANNSVIGGGTDHILHGAGCGIFSGHGNNIGEVPRAFIGGGYGNIVNGIAGMVGGGAHNIISSGAVLGTIGGGTYNTITGSHGTSCGGKKNQAGNFGFVGGGTYNQAIGEYSVVAGGGGGGAGHGANTASGVWSAILGGKNNTVHGSGSVVCGGGLHGGNTIHANAGGGFIGSGEANIMHAGFNCFIGCGRQNQIMHGQNSSILGGAYNTISLDANNYNVINTHIIGSYINANTPNTTFVNNLHIKGVWNPGSQEFSGGGITFPDGTVQTTAGGGGGGGFDQNLNTTDAPTFAGLEISSDNTLTFNGGPGNGGMSISGDTNNSSIYFGLGGTINFGDGSQLSSATAVTGVVYEVRGTSNIIPVIGNHFHGNSFNVIAGGEANDAHGTNTFIGGGSGNETFHTSFNTVVCGGADNTAAGNFSSILGGHGNNVNGDYSSILGGRSNDTHGKNNAHIIGSYIIADAANTAFVNNLKIMGAFDPAAGELVGGGITFPDGTVQTTAAGGGGNSPYEEVNTASIRPASAINECTVSGNYSVVGGGFSNHTGAQPYATVSGGKGNLASNIYSTVGGGGYNTASGAYSVVAGGGASYSGHGANYAAGSYSSVLGGYGNNATGAYSTAVGGKSSLAWADYGTVCGGEFNSVGILGDSVRGPHSFIGGGRSNATGYSAYSSVVGGYYNVINNTNISASTAYNFIGGGFANKILFGYCNVICSGGIANNVAAGNRLHGNNNFIGAGNYNVIAGSNNFIGTGTRNNITEDSSHCGILCGHGNNIISRTKTNIIGYGITADQDTTTFFNRIKVTGELSGAPLGAPLIILNLPTSDPIVAGAVWNDNGTLKISAGV